MIQQNTEKLVMSMGGATLGSNGEAKDRDSVDKEDFEEGSVFSKLMAESHVNDTQLHHKMDKGGTGNCASRDKNKEDMLKDSHDSLKIKGMDIVEKDMVKLECASENLEMESADNSLTGSSKHISTLHFLPAILRMVLI